jgi:predicted choloylglycine hydrolase
MIMRWRIMLHPRLAGSYYDMGFHYGSILYKHGFRFGEQPDERLRFGKECETEVSRVFPEVLKEISGFADACHAPYDHLSAFILGVGAFKPVGACSVFAVKTGSDVLFGRNYDFYYRFKQHIESYLTQPLSGYWSLGNTDIFVGREDGVNEKGLAIGMTAVAPNEIKAGINFALLTRCILDKCANVREATNVLTSAHHVTANNYLVADREGNTAVIEACSKRVMVRKPKENEDFIVSTNHFIHSDMYSMENQSERPPDSVRRYTTIFEKLQQLKGKTTVEDAQRILSDHIGLVCSHIEEIKLGTLWSLIATLSKQSICMAEGHPCKTRYKLDMRLSKALQTRLKRL